MAQDGQKSKAVHPPYSVMVSAAISSLNDRSGSSRPAILNYIKANYQVTHPQAAHHLNMSFKAGLKKGSLKMARPAGKGANSFKLVKNAEPTKTVAKPAQKPTSTKKEATNGVKKVVVKGSDKKSKATKEKNNGKKATKKAVKKDVAKKPSKTVTLKQPAKKATSAKSKTTEKKTIKKTTLKKPVKKSMKSKK